MINIPYIVSTIIAIILALFIYEISKGIIKATIKCIDRTIFYVKKIFKNLTTVYKYIMNQTK